MKLAEIDAEPFHELAYRSAAEGSNARLPFLHARVEGKPAGLGAILATSDLQGRAQADARLLGEAVVEEVTLLQEIGDAPPIDLVLLTGDFFAAPDADKMGASGDVTSVLNAFATIAPVLAVLGNHDVVVADALDQGVTILDGAQTRVGDLVVGGVCGIVGRAGKPQRKPWEAFARAMRTAATRADVLLTHHGPDAPERGEIGSSEIREALERHGDGLHLFGHCRWAEPTAAIGGWTALNLDGRVVLLD